jgi:two-component system OmpR family response regulator
MDLALFRGAYVQNSVQGLTLASTRVFVCKGGGMKRRIVYVEDNDSARESYAQGLRDEGFEVSAYGNKDDAIAALRTQLPDLALLDVSHADDRDAGYQICAEIRRISAKTPIIFLTNRHGEVDRISGLRLGADDYISKEASIDYIVVRIEALFRRLDAMRGIGEPQERPTAVTSGIELDEVYSTVSWKGKQIEMPLTHFWMVRDMCLNPGKVRSHRELMKAACIVVEPNTIAVHIKAIRSTFSSHDPLFGSIKTERGRGYRWVEE